MIDDSGTKQDINGTIPYHVWYTTDSMGDCMNGNDCLKIKAMSLLAIFFLMFPPDHLIVIINLTNKRLHLQGHEDTTKGEIIKFFGVIILGTKFVFGKRRELWNTSSVSHLIDPPNFGARTG